MSVCRGEGGIWLCDICVTLVDCECNCPCVIMSLSLAKYANYMISMCLDMMVMKKKKTIWLYFVIEM